MNEPYSGLYMFYEPQGKLFEYEGQSIRQIQFDPMAFLYQTYIYAPPSDGATQGYHNKKIPIGRYRCSLYGDYNRRGGPLQYVDVFLGTQIDVTMRKETDRSGFEKLFIESYYKFPQHSIFLTFEESLGERIYLPEMMMKEGRIYSTGCIIPPGAFDELTVAVSEDIKDCISIRKLNRG